MDLSDSPAAPTIPHGHRVGSRTHRLGSPVLRPISCADMPSPIPRWDRRWDQVAPLEPATAAFPVKRTGRLPHPLVFEACSAFTHVTACLLAESPSDSFHQRL